MKTAVTAKPNFMASPIIPLPNAASRRQYLHKLLDTLLIIASGVGIVVMLIFLLMLI